ncbi:hypothetical protein L6452_30530 [Arctium lappa]|uniref:Uncharacterized protein n=1 Tax=Arctium lappa TaxID=4217 RepID=A0ACB8ZIJ5_ARCLA|nr:hypothetical protein L6452_30530 [Arctium lappa]
MTPSKNYKDAYDDVDEEFSTIILPQNDNTMPRVDPLDLGRESRDDYFWTDCRVHQTVIWPLAITPAELLGYLVIYGLKLISFEWYDSYKVIALCHQDWSDMGVWHLFALVLAFIQLVTLLFASNYVFALLTGYHDPPADVTIKEYGTPTIEAQSRDGKPLDQTS